MSDELAFNTKIIEEFRANAGQVGGQFEGSPLLLLHNTGARSGRSLVTPLMYQAVGDDFAVFASYRGSETDPFWYGNLLAHPDITVEVGTETIPVRARVLDDAERGPIWEEQTRRFPNFAKFQAQTSRKFPVVLLERR